MCSKKRRQALHYSCHAVSHKDILNWKENFDYEFRYMNFERKTQSTSAGVLESLYCGQLGLKQAKYDALISLFHMKPTALPEEYRFFYENEANCPS
ncbi:hypothetical protein QE152_g38318 [Popillia japonica]|uniref:Uncharacterized protein n=1 Tax=Popillia japonica TaxID=7064 RepID=A0AAW1I6D1_POPJA